MLLLRSKDAKPKTKDLGLGSLAWVFGLGSLDLGSLGLGLGALVFGAWVFGACVFAPEEQHVYSMILEYRFALRRSAMFV